jgi:hypothetical protein
MLLSASAPRTLGVAERARVRFGEEPKQEGTFAGRRLLFLDERPAFELSFWCGTCQFLFKRLEGANQTASLEDVGQRLADGLDGIDEEIVDRFAELLPQGMYVPMLLQIEPRLVLPADNDDYFANEQVATWNLEGFWGLPHYPQTPYYRTFETVVRAEARMYEAEAHLYEFVVPMVPPSWNEPARVTELAEKLARSSGPTAVTVSTLDVSQPAIQAGPDYYAHWGLTHFLLDGHHKLQAAAQIGRPLQLLSLLSVDASLATPEQVQSVPDLLTRPASRRPGPT